MAQSTAVENRFDPSRSFAPAAVLPEVLEQERQRSRTALDSFGLPERRQEAWRFTPLGSITEVDYSRPEESASACDLSFWSLPGAARLVFVNGRLDTLSSDLGTLPPGIFVDDLHGAATRQPERLSRWLGRLCDGSSTSFAALNGSAQDNGAFIHVGARQRLERPVHLVFVSRAAEQPVVSYPRNLIVLEDAAAAALVVSHVDDGGQVLSLPLSELFLGAAAKLDLTVIAEESRAGSLVADWRAEQGADSRLEAQLVSMGGPLMRHDLQVTLKGEAAHCGVHGLYLPRGEQMVDHHLRLEHAVGGATSDQLFRGILDDRSRAVFNGKVVVAEQAQKTDANQSNKNLLLSDRARVHSNPQLEIFADDVRCTHGSAIGRLDKDAAFYLRSRGIPAAEADAILAHAFAAEAVQKISNPEVAQRVHELLRQRLPLPEAMVEQSS